VKKEILININNNYSIEHAILQRFDLTGRVAAITGGGGELCGAMAEALGAVGVKVAVLDIHLGKAEERAQSVIRSGGTAAALQCDVLDPVRLRECCEEVSHLWGPPDFLINGAGGNDPRGSTSMEFHDPAGAGGPAVKSFFDLDPAGFRQVFDLNFMGTFLTTQAFAAGMVAKGKGSLVNISSMSAVLPLTKVAAYSAAKAAVSNFTKWLAVHFSQTGVRVNALAPGFFMTEQLRFLTLPLIRSVLIAALMLRSLDNLKEFDIIYTITQGGPGIASETLYLYSYNVGFSFFKAGYGLALMVVVFLIVQVFNVIMNRLRHESQAV
jgi:NAD(P)-dependent dehydrogenase (short-subunit alcohol dehydrogenase family)